MPKELQTAKRKFRRRTGGGVCDSGVPFHEMSTFGRREYLSVVKLPPKCDVFACFQ